MDYDRTDLAEGYDAARAVDPARMDMWMDLVADHGPGRLDRILDLGCGTGRFSTALSARFESAVIGIDPARSMLARACKKARPDARVRYLSGAGEALPLRRACVDLVFISQVFHHFVRPEDVARECRRVLRPGGVIFVRTGTADRAASYPHSEFFPEARTLASALLPSVAQVCAVFESAGFASLHVALVEQQIAATHAAFADMVAARGDSILEQLEDRAFEAGLHALRAHAATVDPRPVHEPLDLFVFA